MSTMRNITYKYKDFKLKISAGVTYVKVTPVFYNCAKLDGLSPITNFSSPPSNPPKTMLVLPTSTVSTMEKFLLKIYMCEKS